MARFSQFLVRFVVIAIVVIIASAADQTSSGARVKRVALHDNNGYQTQEYHFWNRALRELDLKDGGQRQRTFLSLTSRGEDRINNSGWGRIFNPTQRNPQLSYSDALRTVSAQLTQAAPQMTPSRLAAIGTAAGNVVQYREQATRRVVRPDAGHAFALQNWRDVKTTVMQAHARLVTAVGRGGSGGAGGRGRGGRGGYGGGGARGGGGRG